MFKPAGRSRRWWASRGGRFYRFHSAPLHHSDRIRATTDFFFFSSSQMRRNEEEEKSKNSSSSPEPAQAGQPEKVPTRRQSEALTTFPTAVVCFTGAVACFDPLQQCPVTGQWQLSLRRRGSRVCHGGCQNVPRIG